MYLGKMVKKFNDFKNMEFFILFYIYFRNAE